MQKLIHHLGGLSFPASFLRIFIHLMGPSGRSTTPKERLDRDWFAFSSIRPRSAISALTPKELRARARSSLVLSRSFSITCHLTKPTEAYDLPPIFVPLAMLVQQAQGRDQQAARSKAPAVLSPGRGERRSVNHSWQAFEQHGIRTSAQVQDEPQIDSSRSCPVWWA